MWTLLLGCKVVDAPEDLEELMVFGFVNTEERDAFVEETLDGLVPLAELHHDDLVEGFRVDSLTEGDLLAVGVTTDRKLDVVGVASLVVMSSSVDEMMPLLAGGNLDGAFEATIAYTTTDDSDKACFLAHECDEFRNHGSRTTDAGLLGTATQEFDSVFRWVNRADETPALLLRQLSPKKTEMSVDLVIVHQSYSLAAIFEHGGETWRLEAYWADAEVVGLDVPDSLALDQAVSAMATRAEELDAFLGN